MIGSFYIIKSEAASEKYCYDLYSAGCAAKSVYIKQMIFVRGHDYVQCACS